LESPVPGVSPAWQNAVPPAIATRWIVHRPPRRGFLRLLPLVLALAEVPARSKPAWPARPLRLLVPQAPGGAVDLVSRVVAERLEQALGVVVVVENKPGASGAIGVETVRRAPADGYTLLAASSNTHAMLPHLMDALPYDPLRDFAPVANFAYTTKMIVVGNAVSAKTLEELVGLARRRPDGLNYGSSGIGSSNHLDAEVFSSAAGIRMVHVPYRGSAQALAAVVAGEVQVLLVSATSALPLVQAGRVRPLAIFSDRHIPQLPDVPTVTESGYPGLDVRTWVGFVAPAGTRSSCTTRCAARGRISCAPSASSSLSCSFLRISIGETPRPFGSWTPRSVTS
jgi:tripartite-type tricarboxylate transporter receptor subunit TctC